MKLTSSWQYRDPFEAMVLRSHSPPGWLHPQKNAGEMVPDTHIHARPCGTPGQGNVQYSHTSDAINTSSYPRAAAVLLLGSRCVQWNLEYARCIRLTTDQKSPKPAHPMSSSRGNERKEFRPMKLSIRYLNSKICSV